MTQDAQRRGPPPLKPFGLVLHHDGSWTHEGLPVRNRKLRQAFDRGVAYAAAEGVFVVELQHFRGQIEVEEAPFFVRMIDVETGDIELSDRTCESLDASSLVFSPRDGALLCRVKRELLPEGILARFSHAAQAEFMNAVEFAEAGPQLRWKGSREALPAALTALD
jgi:hypothetical protein